MIEFNPFSALSDLGGSSKDRLAIADNFDTFLTLLTTQLRHQNPLDPLDTNDFTAQLVQFTQVEQTIKQNDTRGLFNHNPDNLREPSRLTANIRFPYPL